LDFGFYGSNSQFLYVLYCPLTRERCQFLCGFCSLFCTLCWKIAFVTLNDATPSNAMPPTPKTMPIPPSQYPVVMPSHKYHALSTPPPLSPPLQKRVPRLVVPTKSLRTILTLPRSPDTCRRRLALHFRSALTLLLAFLLILFLIRVWRIGVGGQRCVARGWIQPLEF
jgi:hypothetical protein